MTGSDKELKIIDAYIREKRYDTALRELRKAADGEGGTIEIYERLGYIYSVTGEYDLAISMFNKLTAFDPHNPDPYHELGNMYKMKGMYDEAIASYQIALDINPDRPVSIEGICLCRAKKEFKKIHNYVSEKKYESAMKELKQILAQSPGYLEFYEVYEELGRLYNAMGEEACAIDAFKKSIELNSDRPEPYHELGNLFKMKSMYDEAIYNYKMALEKDPERAVSLSGIGFCMMKKGDNERAIENFKKAIELDPKEIYAYRNLLEIYLSQDKYREIKELYAKIKQLDIMDKDSGIKYLLVKAELFRDYRDSLKGSRDLNRLASGIYKKISMEKYSHEEEEAVLNLLADDFLSEADYLRTRGRDAEAILRYKNALSVEPNNEKARKGLYFTEKYLHASTRPHFCAVSIVFRCMMRCKMCRIWENKETEELSIESWKRIIDDLSEFMDDNRTINFAGGEPLLKEGLMDLIDYAHKRGFKPAICTNGWLIDNDMARRLTDSGIDIVAISLDSLDEKTHDYLRGIEGSYKRVMNAIEYLNRHNIDKKIRVHVQPIISQVNLEGLIELTHWVNRHEGIGDITFLAVIQPPHTNSDYQAWYKKEEFKSLWPQDKRRIDFVMDELIRLKTGDKERSYKIGNQIFQLQAYKEYFSAPSKFYRRKIQCNIGTQFVNIHTNGDVKLCHYSNIIIGNASKERMEDIWYSKTADSVREKIKVCDKKCHQILNCMKDENPYVKDF